MIGSRIASKVALHGRVNAPKQTLVVIAGQSNAVGQGLPGNLTGGNGVYVSAYPAVPLRINLSEFFDPPVWTYNEGVDTQPLFHAGATKFGAELSLARYLNGVKPSGVCMAKYAIGGSGLQEWWLPSGNYPTGQTQLVYQFIDWVNQAKADCGATKVVLVWLQGERDALFTGTASAYAANMVTFMGLVRAGLGSIPIVVGRVHSSNAGPFVSVVQAQEATYVSGDALSTLVNVDAAALSGDFAHFTADGYITLGTLLGPATAAYL